LVSNLEYARIASIGVEAAIEEIMFSPKAVTQERWGL
jgi:hypothetical protein